MLRHNAALPCGFLREECCALATSLWPIRCQVTRSPSPLHSLHPYLIHVIPLARLIGAVHIILVNTYTPSFRCSCTHL